MTSAITTSGKIEVRSRTLAKQFVSDAPWAAISISTESGDFPELSPQNRVGLLRLQFWDISTPSARQLEAEDPKLFSKEQAQEILDFVNEHWSGVETLLVHCEAGQSRSPAVAAAIAHIKVGQGAEKWWFDSSPKLNRFVYSAILAQHYGMSLAEMSAKAFEKYQPKAEEILDEPWEVG